MQDRVHEGRLFKAIFASAFRGLGFGVNLFSVLDSAKAATCFREKGRSPTPLGHLVVPPLQYHWLRSTCVLQIPASDIGEEGGGY